MIRGKNKSKQCPFGLEIPFGCKNVGNSILEMILIEDTEDRKKESLEYNNKRLVAAVTDSALKCPFANEIYEDKDKDWFNKNFPYKK